MKAPILVLTGMLVVASAAGRAQNPPAAPSQSATMASQQQMMASMQTSDKKLDDLVAQLNAARGDDRLNKVIAVVKGLVAERKAMRHMMAGSGMMMNREPAAGTGYDHATHHPESGK
jgi:hypothetical protein